MTRKAVLTACWPVLCFVVYVIQLLCAAAAAAAIAAIVHINDVLNTASLHGTVFIGLPPTLSVFFN